MNRPQLRSHRTKDTRLLILCALVIIPVLASMTSALWQNWTPVGDNATLAIRTGDVLRSNAPSTGMPTTANAITDLADLDHPGPLFVWVSALPYALLGPAGLLIATAVVNAASLLVGLSICWRRSGFHLSAIYTAISVVLCWSLGALIIRDPLNIHIQLLPWFALAFVCWDVRLGRWWSLPPLVMLSSWAAQAHVSYVALVGVLWIATAAAIAFDHWKGAVPRLGTTKSARRPALLWAGGLALLLNLPMLIDQVWGSGNLSKLATLGSSQGQGLGVAVLTLIGALGFVPSWLSTANDPLVLLRSPTTADVIMATITVGLLAWTWARASQRKDRLASTLIQAALASLVAVAVLISRTPKGGAILAADAMFILKPATALIWLSTGFALWRDATSSVSFPAIPTRFRPIAVATGVLLTLVITAVTVAAPARFGGYGHGFMATARVFGPDAVREMKGQRLVQVNADGWAGRLFLRHSVIEHLERGGIPTRTAEPERAFRRYRPTWGESTATVWVVTSSKTSSRPAPGAELIASTQLVPGGQNSPEAKRWNQLKELIASAGKIQLKDGPQISLEDLHREYFRWESPPEDNNSIPSDWIGVDVFVELARNGMIASPAYSERLVNAVHEDTVDRYFAGEDFEAALYIRYE